MTTATPDAKRAIVRHRTPSRVTSLSRGAAARAGRALVLSVQRAHQYAAPRGVRTRARQKKKRVSSERFEHPNNPHAAPRGVRTRTRARQTNSNPVS